METRILFFGPLKDIASAGERTLSVPASITTIDGLIDYLAKDDPALGDALRAIGVRVAVDQKLADASDKFSTPEEIAFMAPFSGG